MTTASHKTGRDPEAYFFYKPPDDATFALTENYQDHQRPFGYACIFF